MARFTKLTMQGFLPFDKEQTVNLADVGLTRIEGVNLDDESARSNGSGKSAVIDGLYWTLYGLTTHEESAKGDDVIHLHGDGKNCLNQAFFEKDGHSYVVRRGRACTGAAKRLLGKTSGLSLDRDGEPITLGTIDATQQLLNGILGMTHSTFRHCVLFGQSKAYRFATLTDREAKAVFDDMLGVELYTKAGELASKKLKELKETERDNEHDLELHQSALDDTERLEAQYVEREELALEVRSEKLLESQEVIDDLKADFDTDLGRDTRSKERAVASVNVTNADDEFTLIVNQQMKFKAVATHLEEEAEKARVAATDVRDLGAGECTTCGADITEESRDDYVKRLEGEAVTLDRKSRKADKKVVGMRDSILAARKDKKEAQAVLREEQRLFDNLKAQKKVQALQAKNIEAAERALLKLEREESPYKQLASDAKAKALLHRLKRDACLERKEALAVENKMLSFWREAYNAKGLRSLMVDSVLPYLNARAEEYSNTITAGNILVEFRTQKVNKSGELKEEMHIHVENSIGGDKYNLNSIGERAKIDLVVGLALQDMAISKSKAHVNIAFFDEPFDGLDDVAMDRVVDLLSNVLRKRESVFVITHAQSLQAYIPQSLQVTKKDKRSTIK